MAFLKVLSSLFMYTYIDVTYFLFCNCREERNQTQVLRQQQDEAYLASLRADQEKDRKKREEQEQKRQEEEKARQSILAEERRRRVSDLLLYKEK